MKFSAIFFINYKNYIKYSDIKNKPCQSHVGKEKDGSCLTVANMDLKSCETAYEMLVLELRICITPGNNRIGAVKLYLW